MKTKILTLCSSFISTLKDTSFDDDKKIHMTLCAKEAIDFDAFKTHYAHKRSLNENNTPRSCDALFICKNDALHFIEFRNASSKRNFKQQDVKEKIYDSLLILSDSIGETISTLATCTNLVIVYNENMYKAQSSNSPKNIPRSESFRAFSNAVSTLANTRVKEFQLASFEGFCFKKVYTLTQAEFEQHISNL